METQTLLKGVSEGEYIRLKAGGPVWVRGEYDRSTKTYRIFKFDDVNHESYRKGTSSVFIGFEF